MTNGKSGRDSGALRIKRRYWIPLALLAVLWGAKHFLLDTAADPVGTYVIDLDALHRAAVSGGALPERLEVERIGEFAFPQSFVVAGEGLFRMHPMVLLSHRVVWHDRSVIIDTAMSPDAAKKMLDETGCAGVSIGRGAFYNPWIFRQTQHYLRTGELLPEPTFDERMGVMGRHFDLMIEVFGEELGCRMFRKIAAWYARRFGPAVDFRRRVVTIRSRADFSMAVTGYRTWRAQFCDEQGELRPKFQPPKLVASFLRTEPSQPDGVIPVPRGPIERW